MRFTRDHLVSLLVAASVTACGSDSSRNAVKTAFAQRPASQVTAPVAFRFPEKAGGGVRVYRLPRLDEVAFRFNTPGLAADRILGYSDEDDQIYLVSPRGTLVGLDLGTGRSRTVDSSVAAAIAGPTGTPFVLHTDGSMVKVEHRKVVAWGTRLEEAPAALIGAGRSTLLVEMRSPGKRLLLTLSANRPTVSQVIPEGQVAASPWADVAVIGTDSGLVYVNPAKAERPIFLAMRTRPKALAMSPSSHRIYAATEADLTVFDRFGRGELARAALPGPIGEIRPDAFGRYLLLRPALGDSIWIFDVSTNRYIATIRGSWDRDLPTVAADGSILIRRANDVSTVAGDSLTTVGRSRGSGADRWLTLEWDPRRPALQLAEEAEPSVERTNELLYVQVSMSQNESWAQDLADNLKRSGLNASVLMPATPDEGYRVVLGPYPTREAADDAGRKLGKPFWVFSRGQAPTTP